MLFPKPSVNRDSLIALVKQRFPAVVFSFLVVEFVLRKHLNDLKRVVSTIDDIPGVENSTASQVSAANIFP
jgi:hypothetical protein